MVTAFFCIGCLDEGFRVSGFGFQISDLGLKNRRKRLGYVYNAGTSPAANIYPLLSIANDGDNHRATAGADVAFQMENLLPGAQDELPVGYGNGQRRAH